MRFYRSVCYTDGTIPYLPSVIIIMIMAAAIPNYTQFEQLHYFPLDYWRCHPGPMEALRRRNGAFVIATARDRRRLSIGAVVLMPIDIGMILI